MPSYYLNSVTGDDLNDGLSETTPWKTITQLQAFIDANSPGLVAGDTVYFARQCTFAGNIEIKDSGELGNPITFNAYGTGSKPTIDAGNVDVGGPPGSCIGCWSGRSYITIKNLKLQNAKYYAIDVDTCDNWLVDGCEITDSGVGVNCNSNHSIFRNNYIHDLRMVIADGTPDNDYGAIAFNVALSTYCTFENNQIIDCRAVSPDYGYDGAAFEIWRTVQNCSFLRNYVKNCDCFMEAGGEGSDTFSDCVFAYNVIVDCYGGLSQMHLTSGFNIGTVNNIAFYNNTFIQPYDEAHVAVWFSIGAAPTSGQAIYRNNIFVMAGSNNWGMRFGTVTHTNNIIFGVNIGVTLHATEKNVDPQFVNTGSGDYHLRVGSPGIDAGANVSLTQDYDGTVVGSSPDIGAFEYVAPANVVGSRFHIWSGTEWV